MRALIVTTLLSLSASALADVPLWVNGEDPEHPIDGYVLGVGSGSSRKSAEDDARAEVARVFSAHVQSVTSDFAAAARTVNSSGKGVEVEVQEVSALQRVTTNQTLTGVVIRARAVHGDTHYALAALDRSKCTLRLAASLKTTDSRIRAAVDRAKAQSGRQQLRQYGVALRLMDERGEDAAMYRICEPSGRGIAPPVALATLVAKFEGASKQMKLGITVTGDQAARVRDCLLESLGKGAFAARSLDGDEPPPRAAHDAIVAAEIRIEPGGEIAGSKLARAELVVRLIDPKSEKILRTVRGSRKDGRPSYDRAASLAAFKVCQKKVPAMITAIEQYFRGG